MSNLVLPEGPRNAKIFILGEAPGAQEDKDRKPFRGYAPAGRTLNSLLTQAGIVRGQCFITNVMRRRPPNNQVSYYFKNKSLTQPTEQLSEWLEELKEEIEEVKPNIVVALGAVALWALTGSKGIAKNRGAIGECSLVPGQKYIATYHPQAVNYQWQLAFIATMDLRKAKKHGLFKEISKQNRVLISEPTKEQWISYCDFLIDEFDKGEIQYIGVDLEHNRDLRHMTRMSFSHHKDFAMSIPLIKGSHPTWPEKDEINIMSSMANVLEHIPSLYHNASFDVTHLWKTYNIKCKIKGDTLILSHILWPELPRSLGFCVSMWLDYPEWKSTSQVDPGLYSCYDTANLIPLYDVMMKFINDRILKGDKKILEVYEEELGQIDTAIFLQYNGNFVNNDKRLILLKKTDQTIQEAKEELFEIIGETLNYNSHIQVHTLLYEKEKLPMQFKRRKTISEQRKLTADDEALDKLNRTCSSKVPSLIIKYRKATKRKSSFLEMELSPNKRVHSSYNVAGTGFSRWSSSKSLVLPFGPGNLQNIPEETRIIYEVEQGYSILRADYVQAEAAVVARLSCDTPLIKLFEEAFGMSPSERKKEHDIHKYTAATMLSKDQTDINSIERRNGKTLRHACSYLGGPGVIANELGVSISDGKLLYKMYRLKNGHLTNWQDKLAEQFRINRTFYNCFGRSHRFLGRWDHHLHAALCAYNPQSTIGDLLNRAIRRVYQEKGDEYDIWMQLHDALYVRVEDSKIDQAIEDIRRIMLIPIKIEEKEVLVDVDFAVGKNWGEMKELDIGWK